MTTALILSLALRRGSVVAKGLVMPIVLFVTKSYTLKMPLVRMTLLIQITVLNLINVLTRYMGQSILIAPVREFVGCDSSVSLSAIYFWFIKSKKFSSSSYIDYIFRTICNILIAATCSECRLFVFNLAIVNMATTTTYIARGTLCHLLRHILVLK